VLEKWDLKKNTEYMVWSILKKLQFGTPLSKITHTSLTM
jgi:hypothetical protein